MPVESWVARERRYGQWSGPQKGSEERASRRAGRMWGSGGRAREIGDASGVDSDVADIASDEVERREAAIVRRRWDSVLRVAEVMQATTY